MSRASDNVLFEDIFEIQEKDPDGKKFDRVSRFVCRSDLYEFDLVLDVNIDLYPLKKGEKFSLMLAKALTEAGTSTGKYDETYPGISNKPTLMDRFDYVMYGKVFKYRDSSAGGQIKVEVYVSFGGLLMQLTGDPKKLQVIELDQHMYLLMRKV